MRDLMNMGRFTLILFTIFVFLQVETMAYEPEMNTDRPGKDYRNFELGLFNDWNFCKQQCDRDPKCRAWTFVKPSGGAEGKPAHCWLKNGVPEKKPNTCCISGIKLQIKPSIARTVLKKIFVTFPDDGTVCAINTDCPIKWRTNNIDKYPTVFLQVVYTDGSSAAGAYPVPNTGQYDWKPDSSWYDDEVYCKEFRMKVFTTDNKHSGMSGRFKVGKFINGCP